MTSAISAAMTPFETIAKAEQPITAKVIKDAAAGAPEELKKEITEDSLYADLKQIVATNVFGENTPKLADDAAARLATLEPAKEASGFNNLAAAFSQALNEPPLPGPIWENARNLNSMLTGALVALEAGLASTTPEQKADKEALLDGFKSRVLGPQFLKVLSGTWAALATPVGDGTFTLPHDVAEAMTASVKKGEVTEGLKTLLFSKLSPEGIGAKLPSASSAKASAEAVERERTRPIGGKTQAELEALYKGVSAKAQIPRITYRAETVRPPKYQKILNALNQGPLAQILPPILKEYIGRMNVAQRRAQKANYTEISAQNAAKTDDKQLQAIRKVALRCAELMGAGDPSVTRIAQDVLNAWVSSVDLDNPHITYFSHLQDIVWDGEKGDWLRFHVDAKGNICEADAPGAKEVSCEQLVMIVFLHELGHIFEGAVLNQFMLAIVLGVFLDSNAAKLHADGCLCNSCGAAPEKVELAQKLMAEPQIQALMKDGSLNPARLAIARELGIEEALSTYLRLSPLFGPGGDLEKSEMTTEQKAQARASLSGLEDFFLMFTREGETTADSLAVLLMGPEAPRWLAMTFDIVSRSSGKGSPAERLQAVKESYARNHLAEAEEKLEYSEEGGALSHAQYATATTHPTRILRALGNFRFAERKETQAVWAFEAQPPAIRLLGAAQAVESEIERIQDRHADYQHGASADKPGEEPEAILKTLENTHAKKAVARQQERMRLVTSEIAKLVFADGLDTKEGRIPYATQVEDFMREQGEPIFREHDSGGGGGGPLAALFGAATNATPACAKMAAQVAEELQKVIDAAKPGEEERAAWLKVVESYQQIANGGEGAQEARIARTQRKSAMRTMRGKA